MQKNTAENNDKEIKRLYFEYSTDFSLHILFTNCEYDAPVKINVSPPDYFENNK